MKYYFLRKNLEKNIIYLNSYQSNIIDISEQFENGKKLKGKIDYLNATIDPSGGVFSDLIDTLILIVSEKLKKRLLELDSNLEEFPIKLINRDQEKITGYYAINILNTLDTLDMEKSEYTYYDKELGIIDKVTKLVIDENKTKGRNIFRDENFGSIVVSEVVKQELNSFDGLSFTPVENYKYPI